MLNKSKNFVLKKFPVKNAKIGLKIPRLFANILAR